MEEGAVGGIEPVARIGRQEIDFSPLRECHGLVHYEPALVNARLDSHAGRISPDAIRMGTLGESALR